MNALLVAVVLGAVAGWLVAFVACVRFSLTYHRWQKVTGRGFSFSDPARNYEYAFRFFGFFETGTDSEPHPDARRLQDAGRRHAKLAGVGGAVFAACVLLLMLVAEVD